MYGRFQTLKGAYAARPVKREQFREKMWTDRRSAFNKKIFHMRTDRRIPAWAAADGRQ
jgi:hypothetical protein